ncbi:MULTISPECIES: sulfate adenylyltransferase [unclassified Campylobacter]|uniref:sulfate adenylyltransferase n=1 Tax=unclassified Campylobacter TaxID=2593542 RepID=UPI0022E9B06C|nr:MULTISPECIES: sulfate adenylyltransferase [unclassified Campylobacter]MDA3043921.1 sulfate adenylyltransferase [Campylobacter sp. JMF_09 ED2]MDA3045458.1 sulfate adenylyltransferase [Campylobacter sp. JMF_07 ED4]MDA3060595.1 sulfate adenylyltransferase [Campylobacter sp. VBCF_02 NA5]MDA3064122.1 sulfate adenylyltransferase [Campylobacter sp. JMF_11 EL3]MDA3072006.1 sulfate adenylyltransferase [Campylobacter sp. VBCF_03 NA9]
MVSREKNSIEISKSELCALHLLKFGAFGGEDRLKNGKNFAFVAGKFRTGAEVNLICEGEICGKLKIISSQKITDEEKQNSVFENKRPGNEAIRGELSLNSRIIGDEFAEFFARKSSFKNPRISAFFTMADPLHRVHERLLRLMIDKADFVVIFLVGSSRSDAFSANLRKKTLEFLCENFLVKERVLLIDLNDFSALNNHSDPTLECAIAHNLGINKVVFGQKHKHVAGYFDHGDMHSVLDFCDYENFEIWLMPEYVYCNKCKVLSSVKNCPHGSHHHVHYHTRNLKAMLYAGILPPALFMRKEISAMILAELFPNRFADLQALYDDLFPNDGLIEPRSESEFYEELMRLYQTSALKT